MNQNVRVVVYQEDDVFIAQCLELDIGAQASDMETLRKRFEATLSAELSHCAELGKDPADVIGEAPKSFFDRWDSHGHTAKNTPNFEMRLCA